ncbi:MAG TPA: hypothetical protein VN039_07780 [Nitrospira sp.]|nr:hypothetical protein [Nitrospira sp.]
MSYKCGYCKGRHQKLETVKRCALEAYAERAAHQVDEEPEPLKVGPASRSLAILPAGWYSIWTGSEPTVVVEIRKPASGKWKGRYFVNCTQNGKTEAIFDKADRDKVISDLLAVDFGMYMMLYGKQTGLCPICHEPLSDTEKDIGVHLGTADEKVNTTRDCYKAITE